MFEPYEIVLDFPARLDPLKQTASARAAEEAPIVHDAVARAASDPGVSLDRASWRDMEKGFSALASACRDAGEGQLPREPVLDLLALWERVRAAAGPDASRGA